MRVRVLDTAVSVVEEEVVIWLTFVVDLWLRSLIIGDTLSCLDSSIGCIITYIVDLEERDLREESKWHT